MREEPDHVSEQQRGCCEVLSSSAANRFLAHSTLLGQLHDLVVILDSELCCVYARGELAGRRDAQLLGPAFLEALTPSARDSFRHACHRSKARGSLTPFELRREGQRTLMQVGPLDTGHDAQLLLVVRARVAEPSLHERDERLRYAVEASGVGTWTWDRLRDCLDWDDGLCRIYGLTPAESPQVYGDYLRYLHPEDRPRIEAHIRRCLQSGIYEDFEHRLVHPDGTVRYVFCRGVAETNDRGEVVAISGGIFDITERKRLEEHLRNAQKMEAIGQLAAGIAHNFNNLLSIVLPNTERCRTHAPASLLQPLADIEHAASRAAEMVRQLMLFARHEQGAARVAVHITALVDRTLSICRSTFDRRITIDLVAEDDLPPVLARAGELEQVLLNVCINARDALEQSPNDNPRIELRLARGSPGMVRLAITDNGPGMDEATRTRVFEPFFTTKGVGHGSGLGLASAYAIIREYQGTFRCRSALGEGTEFTIELPVAANAVAPAPALPSWPDSRGDETILLVDDEPLVRRALSAVLEHAGFHVLETDDGRTGLTMVQRSPTVDLILLDRSMPHMSGDEFLTELRAIRPNLPVILLTGLPITELDVSGPFDVITKPPRTAMLLSRIRRMLDETSAREQS